MASAMTRLALILAFLAAPVAAQERLEWGPAYIVRDGVSVTFCNALLNRAVYGSDLSVAYGDGARAMVDQAQGADPDLFTVSAPNGFIAWPVEVLVREHECATITLVPAGLS